MYPSEKLIEFCNLLREKFTESFKRYQFEGIQEAEKIWTGGGDLKSRLSSRLKEIIVTQDQSESGTYNHLRDAYKAFLFDATVGRDTGAIQAATYAIWYNVGWKKILALDSPLWIEGIAIGRALALFPIGELPSGYELTISAAQRLLQRGYKIDSFYGQFIFEEGEEERATGDALAYMNKAGLMQSLNLVAQLIAEREVYAYGMFLASRKTTTHQLPTSSYPYAFIYNLALRCSPKRTTCKSDDSNFREAAGLCNQIVTCLDLEPHHFLEIASVHHEKLDSTLRKTGYFEHLLTIKQWPLGKTEDFLKSFWGIDLVSKHDKYREIAEFNNWAQNILAKIKRGRTSVCPILISRKEMLESGLSKDQLRQLLDVICHKYGTVNSTYNRPGAAVFTDFKSLAFSKPLIEYTTNLYLIPIPSAFGPALLEALLAKCYSEKSLPNNKLVGDGTEAIIKGILSAKKDIVLSCGKKYRLKSPAEEGECDFIVETDKNILFIECKAKAPTRDTMSGVMHEALLDYSGAILAAHAQLLTHERILRARGRIDFIDNTTLELKERRIWRLSVTLHDHGGLQDSSYISAISQVIVNIEFEARSDYSKKTRVSDLNAIVKKIRGEKAALENMGVAPRWLDLTSPSLSVSHLAVILDDFANTDDFMESLQLTISTGTQNPLLEYHNNKGLKKAKT